MLVLVRKSARQLYESVSFAYKFRIEVNFCLSEILLRPTGEKDLAEAGL